MKSKRLISIVLVLNAVLIGAGIYLWLDEKRNNAALTSLVAEQSEMAWKMELTEAHYASQTIELLKASSDQQALGAVRKHLQGKLAILDNYEPKMNADQKRLLGTVRSLANER
ncbi:MAG: hypothetical protein ABJF10_24610 [Chthoniobacter sp.]|uniref:hypothetical protein n=1 Tax=Chthoniobacter sp. TaxID=2510640 RepID=UPI0032A9F1DF